MGFAPGVPANEGQFTPHGGAALGDGWIGGRNRRRAGLSPSWGPFLGKRNGIEGFDWGFSSCQERRVSYRGAAGAKFGLVSPLWGVINPLPLLSAGRRCIRI